MERLLITKNNVGYAAAIATPTNDDDITAASGIDGLAAGSIIGIEKNGTKVTKGGSFSKTDTQGYFALGMPSGVDTRVSPIINWDTLKYNKNVYAAATKQVTVIADDGVAVKTSGAFAASDVGTQYKVTSASSSGDFQESAGTTALLKDVSTGLAIATDTDLTLNQIVEVIAAGTPDAWGGGELTSTLSETLVVGAKAVGAIYGVTIVDLQKENWERRKYDVSLTMTDSSQTDASMLADLVAAINAHAVVSKLVVASVATGDVGIVLTSVNAGERFTALPQGLLLGNTVTSDDTGLSQVADTGEGTNAQLLELEAMTNPIEGKTSTAQADQLGEIWTVPSLVESGLNYTVYVLEWTDQRDVAYVSNASHPSHKRLNIAVPSADSTMIGYMDAILSDLVA